MSIVLRISLIIVSVLCAVFIVSNIRKARVKIEDSVFWVCFSVLLIILSIFPGIVIWGSEVTGVQSPANFIFLVIIFLLIIKLFGQTVRISKLESKLQTLAQTVAIERHNEENK